VQHCKTPAAFFSFQRAAALPWVLTRDSVIALFEEPCSRYILLQVAGGERKELSQLRISAVQRQRAELA
jgi:hypothetical protein